MPGKAVGRAAADLPWLCPNTDGLIGLAERPAGLPRLASADPALLAFLLRFGNAGPSPGEFLLTPDRFLSSSLPDSAAAMLAGTRAGWLDHSLPVVGAVHATGLAAAALARRLADHTHRVNPDAAAAAAQLAPLGWYAVAAVEPKAAAACLSEPGCRVHPGPSQTKLWGYTADEIARRLANRWRLPPWAATTIGHLDTPFRAVRAAVADPDLFAVVQLAVREAEHLATDLALARHADRAELYAHLGLDTDAANAVFLPPLPVPATDEASELDPNPYRVPLVGNVLRLAAESRRRNGASLVLRLEERIDGLHRANAALAADAADRVREAKLAALAELAAGAGHEINNPLAVISVNAQRVLTRIEEDPESEDALRAILRQTQRIAGILRDLMQFARPPRPERRSFAAAELVAGVREDLTALAAERRVRLEITSPADLWLEGDAKQLRHALAALVRNGVEAAGADGWVHLACASRSAAVEFLVEDSGPGLTTESAEHAFDPFFCGRSAGRGRGLGLPTAWSLARQNGGDVRFEPAPDAPTRFVLVVPRSAHPENTGRKSA